MVVKAKRRGGLAKPANTGNFAAPRKPSLAKRLRAKAPSPFLPAELGDASAKSSDVLIAEELLSGMESSRPGMMAKMGERLAASEMRPAYAPLLDVPVAASETLTLGDEIKEGETKPEEKKYDVGAKITVGADPVVITAAVQDGEKWTYSFQVDPNPPPPPPPPPVKTVGDLLRESLALHNSAKPAGRAPRPRDYRERWSQAKALLAQASEMDPERKDPGWDATHAALMAFYEDQGIK